MGKDGERLRTFYADLFDWAIDAGNPLGYGLVQRETNFEGVGIGGGIGGIPEGMPGHLTFYVEVPDAEPALAQAIVTLLRDNDRRRAMGQAGRTRVVREFSVEKMVGDTVKTYVERPTAS